MQFHDSAPCRPRQQPYTPRPDELFRILAAHLWRVQSVHHPAAVITPLCINGWYGPYYDPNRSNALPSLWLRPRTATAADAYRDQQTGAHGSLTDLAVYLGVDPRIVLVPPELRHRLPRRRMPARRTWDAVCSYIRTRKTAP